MNLSVLIKQYFSSVSDDITIDVFDEKNIYDVYQRVVGVLTQYIDIETTVLQAMSYCFYEILDNVLTHSGKELGTVLTHYDSANHILSFLVADAGYRAGARVYWESWQEANRHMGSKQFVQEHTPEYMEMLMRGHLAAGKDVYIVQVAGEAVGVLILDGQENEICTLYVAPAVQKMGIGARMVQFAVAHLDPTREMTVVALDHVPHAGRMYRKAGFVQEIAHRLLNETYNVWETALVRPAENK